MTAGDLVRSLRTAACLTLLILALTWVGTAPAAAAEPLYHLSPAPRWVLRLSPEYDAPLPASGVSDGRWDLLNDRQILVTQEGDDSYLHIATRVITVSGIDAQSQINVRVDPTYQSLLLHAIRVVRHGVVIDQTRGVRIVALPQETELRERIYDGSYNINMLLADVRIGDVVEYEYTLRSRGHIFPGQFSAQVSVGWSEPLRHQRLRVLSAEARPLSHRASSGLEPQTRVHDGQRELTWEWRDLAPISGDDDRPSWYSPWPRIELSTSGAWSEVVRQLLPLFPVKPPSAAVARVVDEIRGAGGPPAAQALHALQFVQEQIRYVSIAIGRGAFQPAAPDTVLARRFGDCKDKALLLATLLQGLGIEARPALVNTRRGHVLDAQLPTPYAFDHAIVRMRQDNRVLWLDATLDKQHSPLSADAPPDYERALVLEDGTAALEVIPRPAPAAGGKASDVLVDLTAGLDRPGRLRINTFYHGSLADAERQSLADDSAGERQKRYANYIVQYYPGAKVAAPITIRDDPSRNIVEVEELYTLDPPFTRTESGQLELFVQPDEIYSFIRPLKSPVRTAPLALPYPADVRQTIHALLPRKPWSFRAATVTVDNPAFRYDSVVRYTDAPAPGLTVDYHYQARSSFVEVAALPAYRADRKRAYEDAGYNIRPPASQPAAAAKRQSPAPPVLLTAVLTLLLAIEAVRLLVRWDPVPAPAQAGWPAGIRGWLLIPALVVVIGPFNAAWALCTWAPQLDDAQWARLHADAQPAWAPAILLAFTGYIVLMFMAEALLAYLFFRRRTSAPPVFIAVVWMMVLHSAAVFGVWSGAHLFGKVDDARLAQMLVLAVLRAVAYTAYMLRSRRVRATFIRRVVARTPSVDAPAQPA